MPEAPKDRDQDKGDELLKRMLKTPPKPHKDKDAESKDGSRPDGSKGGKAKKR